MKSKKEYIPGKYIEKRKFKFQKEGTGWQKHRVLYEFTEAGTVKVYDNKLTKDLNAMTKKPKKKKEVKK